MAKTELFVRSTPGGIFTITGIDKAPGNIFFVNSVTGTDGAGYGTSPDSPVATLNYAVGLCTADAGDVIYILPGHTETWTTTGAKVVFNKAGVRVVGLGQGADRPTFSFGHTGTTWTWSAANVTLENVLLVTGVDQVVTFATISGADATLRDVEVRDASTPYEVVDAFTCTAGAVRLVVERLFHNGYTGGSNNLRTFKMNGVVNALFSECRFLGKAQTAVINFVTVACKNVIVKRCDFLVTSTTNFSKSVVDTITGSTWEVRDSFDLAAGAFFAGGSGSALASLATTSQVGTPVNTGGTATIAAILGDPSNVSFATTLAQVGTLINSGGAATLAGILGDVANSSVATRLTNLANMTQKAKAEVEAHAAGTLWTITGGPIKVNAIIGRVTTQIDAAAATLKIQTTPTGGAATDLCAASASLSGNVVNTVYGVDGVKATGLVVAADAGIGLKAAQANMPLVIVPGVISLANTGAAITNGRISWSILYEPLTPASVVA